MRFVETDQALLDRLDRGTAFAFEEMTRRTPGGRAIRSEGLLLAIGVDPSPVLVNTIFPMTPTVRPEAVDRAVEEYASVGHLPSIITRDHLDEALTESLAASGYRHFLSLPGMVLEARLVDDRPPLGVSIHRVETESDREHWLEGNLYGFAEDDGDRAAMRSAIQTLESLSGGSVTAWWAEADGRGVAAAMAIVDPSTELGILGWVGTDHGYRGLGIGRAVALAATNAAFELGARVVGLQASPMGLPLYERMGYRTVTGYEIWLPPGRTGIPTPPDVVSATPGP
jgi:GNAT superfamily N-acetyltransferase